ncbi:hypothetical protein Hanom_Chr08g00692411 [Helianthus anomalus]
MEHLQPKLRTKTKTRVILPSPCILHLQRPNHLLYSNQHLNNWKVM